MRNPAIILSVMMASAMATPWTVYCQTGGAASFSLVVVNEQRQGIAGATVKVFRNGSMVSAAVAGEEGRVQLDSLANGSYTFLVSSAGYQPKMTAIPICCRSIRGISR